MSQPLFQRLALCLLISLFSGFSFAQDVTNTATNVTGIKFTENVGQLGENSEAYTHYLTINDAQLLFAPDRVSYVFREFETEGKPVSEAFPEFKAYALKQGYRLDMEFIGTNPDVKIEGEGKSRHFFNYYYNHLGLNGAKAYQYDKLLYRNIYPNIDLVFYDNGKGLKYEYIVHPGGDPSVIKYNYNGATNVENSGVKLKLEHPMGFIEEGELLVYEQDNNSQVEAAYQVKDTEVSFAIDAYNRKQTLVIDPPILLWGTYFGGLLGVGATYLGLEQFEEAIFDANGNMYTCGTSHSATGLPVTVGAFQTSFGGIYDMMMAKFDPNGALLWATFYGGLKNDFGWAVTEDNNGDIYFGGAMASFGEAVGGFDNSFNGTSGSGAIAEDAFLAKFTPGGTLIWSTYYGGLKLEAFFSLDVNSNNEVVCGGLTGSRFSGDHPIAYPNSGPGAAWQNTNGAGVGSGTSQDGLLVIFDELGNRLYGTFYGTEAFDRINHVTVDANDNIYCTGFTGVSASPGTRIASSGSHQDSYGGGGNDAFVVKFDPTWTREWATYYGGTGNDAGNGIAADDDGNIYLAGPTNSTNTGNVIATAGAHSEVFQGINDGMVVKFDPAGNRLWGTYYGGTENDYFTDIEAECNSHVYLLGVTRSTDPGSISTPGAYQENHAGSPSNLISMLVRMDADGERDFGTYIGGTSAVVGLGLGHRPGEKNLAIVGETRGAMGSYITPGAVQSTHSAPGSGNTVDAFVLSLEDDFCDIIIDLGPNQDLCGTNTNFQIDANVDNIGCGYTYSWSPAGLFLNPFVEDPIVSLPIGVYTTVTLTVTSPDGTCSNSGSVTYYTSPFGIDLGPDMLLCDGTTETLDAGPGWDTYTWSYPTGLVSLGQTALVNTPGTYCVTVTDGPCSFSDCIDVQFTTPIVIDMNAITVLCPQTSASISPTSVTGGVPPYSYQWSTGATGPTLNISPSGTTFVTLTVTDAVGCQQTANVTILVLPDPNIDLGPDLTVCSYDPNPVLDAGVSAPFTCNWYLDGSLVGSGPTYTANQTGEYSVVCTNFFGCSFTDEVQVDIIHHNFDIVPPAVICEDQTGCFNATSLPVLFWYTQINPSFIWNMGPGSVPQFPVNGCTQFLTDGPHNVTFTVVDEGCVFNFTETINVSETPVVNITTSTGTNYFCTGSTINLQANVGPIGTSTTFLWMPGGQTTSNIDVGPGNYSVTVTTSEGCSTTETISITGPVEATPIIFHSCYQENNGEVEFDVTGGLAPFTYSWSHDPLLTDQVASDLSPGSYTCTITDANGCTQTYTVTVLESIEIMATAVTTPACNNDPTGTMTISATGGSGTYAYSLTGTGFQSSNFFDGLTPGTYNVTVMDDLGCSSVVPVVILSISGGTYDYEVELCAGDLCNQYHEISIITLTGDDPDDVDSDLGSVFDFDVTVPAGELDVDMTDVITVTDDIGCETTFNVPLPAIASYEGTITATNNWVSQGGGEWCMEVTNAHSYYIQVWATECSGSLLYEAEEFFPDVEEDCTGGNVHQLCIDTDQFDFIGGPTCNYPGIHWEIEFFNCDDDAFYSGTTNDIDFDGGCDCCCLEGGYAHWCDDCFFGFLCDPTPTYVDYVIDDQNATWLNQQVSVQGTLRIPAGKTLNITNTQVTFEDGAKIIVERKGQLNIVNSHLKGCVDGVIWQGIEVRGKANKQQTLSEQGKVYVDNSIIQDARIAIYGGSRNENSGAALGNTGGSIVNVVNGSKFLNNGVHVHLTKYTKPNNVNTFLNSLYDQTVLSHRLTGDLQHFYIQGAEGIIVKGNSFKGGFRAFELINTDGMRIDNNTFADIEYIVDGFGDENFNYVDNDASLFKKGIFIKNGETAVISKSKFSNFETAIEFFNQRDISISESVFKKGEKGIVFTNSRAFNIDKNTFEDVKIAIETENTTNSQFPSYITNNRFIRSRISISFKNDNHGNLVIECNLFDKYTEYGVKSESTNLSDFGSQSKGPGNEFDPDSQLPDNCVKHSGNNPTYFYDPLMASSFLQPNVMNISKVPSNDDKGCDNKAISTVVEPTGPGSFKVYPNPNDGNFFLDIRPANDEATTVVMINLLGEIVYSESLKQGQHTVSLEHLSRGVYTVQFTNDGFIETKLITIQ